MSTSSNKPVSGNYLIYGMANQALYRTNPDTDRGIDVTADADWTPSDRSRNNQDLTVGMRLNEPLPGQQNLSPWQIVEQLQPRWPLQLCILPPVFLDYYLNDSGGYDVPRHP